MVLYDYSNTMAWMAHYRKSKINITLLPYIYTFGCFFLSQNRHLGLCDHSHETFHTFQNYKETDGVVLWQDVLLKILNHCHISSSGPHIRKSFQTEYSYIDD